MNSRLANTVKNKKTNDFYKHFSPEAIIYSPTEEQKTTIRLTTYQQLVSQTKG